MTPSPSPTPPSAAANPPAPDLTTVLGATPACEPPADPTVPLPDKFTLEGDHFVPVGKTDPTPVETDSKVVATTLCQGLLAELTGPSGARLASVTRGTVSMVLVRAGADLNAPTTALPQNPAGVIPGTKSLLRVHKTYPKTSKMFPDDLSEHEKALEKLALWEEMETIFTNAAAVIQKNKAKAMVFLDQFNRQVMPRVVAAFPNDVFLQEDAKDAVVAIRGPAQQAVKTKAHDERVLSSALTAQAPPAVEPPPAPLQPIMVFSSPAVPAPAPAVSVPSPAPAPKRSGRAAPRR